MTLDTDITNAFQATQILLVFLTVLFSIRYPQIKNVLNKDIPVDKYKLENLNNELDVVLKSKCGILLITNLIILILFIPLYLQVIIDAKIYIWAHNILQWHYNFNQTSYFFITLMICGFLIWSISLTQEVCKHKKDIQKKINDKKINIKD